MKAPDFYQPSMSSNHPLAQDLQKLHALLESSEKELKNQPLPDTTKRQVGKLRKRIPQPILDHFDRMRLRGKKPIAPVRHAVCLACHLQIPRGHVMNMHKADEIDVCDNCGTFIFLEEAPPE